MADNAKLMGAQITRECALCGLITQDNVVVCPEDGSALITRKPDPLLGATIGGKFEVVALIGSGGMGNVYKALQKPVDRHVAVKVLHSERLNKNAAVLRFQQEAKAAAALSHPNIVGFFDYGLTDDNIPYIVMDYVEGEPLDALFKQGPLSIERCIKIFSQACDALEHAHQKGIVHRDIKPSNLMLTGKDDSESLKILDFGIAKLLPGDGERATLTVTGEVFGSPQYMSPEQCSGSALDARSDVYSLGCVMYEALVGQPPVRGDSLIDTIFKHTHERPAPFKSIRPELEVPEQLEAIVMKTLEKEPGMRFSSMSVLKRNLEFVPAFAEAEKKMAAQAKPPSMVQIFWQRNQKWLRWTIPSVAVLALLAGTTWYLLFSDYSPPFLWESKGKAQITLLEFADGPHSPRLLPPNRLMRDELAKEGKFADAFTYAAKVISLAKESEPNSLNEAIDILAAANIATQQKDDRARDYLLQAREKLRRLADTNRHQRRWQENAQIDLHLSNIDQQLAQKDDLEGIADQLAEAEDVRFAQGIDKAAPLYQNLILLKSKLSKQQLKTLCDGLAVMAQDFAIRGQTEKSESSYKSAIAISTEAYGAQSEQLVQLQRSLGLFYQKVSRFTAAEDMLLEALSGSNAALGESNPQSISILKDLSKLYSEMKEFRKSDEMMKLAESLGSQNVQN